MWLTLYNSLRRIIDSPYHSFEVIPKPDIWPKRERLRRFIAWEYASRRSTVRMGYQAQNKIFHYTDMQRRDKLRLEKHYARQRLDAALTENNMEYSMFKSMLDKAHILLDVIILSNLSIYEPRSFKSLVMLAKKMALEQGSQVIADDEQKYVMTDPSLFGVPFPHPVQFRRRNVCNYKNPPRKLKKSEY